MKSSIPLFWTLALCLISLAACSRREDPAPAAAPQPAPAMAESLRSAAPPAAAPANSADPPAPPAGADLGKVADQAAAFSDLVDSLRKFAGEENEIGAATLDLETFVRGKSDRDLLKFAEAAQYKSPFAAMQVFDYLVTHSADPKIRMQAAWCFGDQAAQFGDAADRARAKECYDLLVAFRGDDAFVSTLSAADVDELLTAMQRLVVTVPLDEQTAYRQLSAQLRNHPSSAEDSTYADWFDAMANLESNTEKGISQMLAHLRAIRERGVYGRYFAQKETIDHWLAKTQEQIWSDWSRSFESRTAFQAECDARQRRLDALPPAERLAELNRQNERP